MGNPYHDDHFGVFPFCAGADNPKLFSTATSDMYMYMPDIIIMRYWV